MIDRDRRDRGTDVVAVTVDADNSAPGEDAIEPARRRSWWQLRRRGYLGTPTPVIAAAVIGALVIVAVVAAYLVGRHQGRNDARVTAPGTSAGASTRASAAGTGSALAQAAGVCAVQVGAQLQLGIEVENTSGAPITLRQLDAVLPLGGLRAAQQLVGTCGQLQQTRAVPGTTLVPGATTWLTITFDVLVTCPTPLPVQFGIHYTDGDKDFTVTLGAFADLGGVSYSGCDAAR